MHHAVPGTLWRCWPLLLLCFESEKLVVLNAYWIDVQGPLPLSSQEANKWNPIEIRWLNRLSSWGSLPTDSTAIAHEVQLQLANNGRRWLCVGKTSRFLEPDDTFTLLWNCLAQDSWVGSSLLQFSVRWLCVRAQMMIGYAAWRKKKPITSRTPVWVRNTVRRHLDSRVKAKPSILSCIYCKSKGTVQTNCFNQTRR